MISREALKITFNPLTLGWIEIGFPRSRLQDGPASKRCV
jgi:hypothetical protein